MPDNFLEALDEKEECEKRYHRSNFRYDEARDTFICPEGKELKRWAEQKREEKPSLIVYRGESSRECPEKTQATTAAEEKLTKPIFSTTPKMLSLRFLML